MTNKERYKQAFSALHSSTVMPMEMEKIAAVSKKAERRRERCCICGRHRRHSENHAALDRGRSDRCGLYL